MDEHQHANYDLLKVSIALSLASGLLSGAATVSWFLAGRRKRHAWWRVIPWLVADVTVWYISFPLRGVFANIFEALMAVPYLRSEIRRRGYDRDD